ncbi:nuclear transport factor 2 family protein [Labrys wisconsinensis]|uniref:Ketosteroid isomerase-like protein n=1 Tax=Labrys wisconsinensis TaxID=425677 RepID=A0ABU0JHZ5_9HYPH|nr:nuclear transport factor 2 family protein [Labrys wisconsinensis]MDQ0472742.1 ketosteroid isomerase-like protein [Labrys wisconsinensis]
MAKRTLIETMLRTCYAMRRAEDIEGALESFTEDATFRLVGNPGLAPLTKAVTGRDALRAMLTQLARDWDWRDYHITSIMVDGDHAVVHSRGRMRYTPKNAAMETETLDLITIRDGKISDFQQFCDTHMAASLMMAGTA